MSAQLMKQEFEAYPESKYAYRYEYLDKLRLSKNPADKVEIEKLLEIIQAQPNLSETDFSQLKFYYERILKDKEKSAAVDKAMKEIYPNGDWVRERRMMALQDEQDQAKRDALFIAYQKDFSPKTEQEENMIEFFAADLATSYGNAGNYEKMKGYALMVKNKSSLASMYNDIAWKLAGEGLNGIAGDITMGKKLSWQSLQLILEAAKESKGCPTYYTEKQWKEQMERSYYMYTDTYALLLYKLGDYIQACDYEQKAVEFNKREDLSMNEMYTLYLEKCKGADAAEKELENFVREGHSTSAMKEQLKKLYIAQSHTESQWNEYVVALEKPSKEKHQGDVVKKMIKEQAPSFSLKDLKGNVVSLASLKGKVVVLDFWATWCGPCIASFPAMKKTMEKYQHDPDVKFVFVNTWENGEKEKVREEVSAFLEKNDWPFNMLMDYENAVVEEYGVEGIPTKFVIDKNNLIRFKSFGFSGSTEGLVDELSQMIELARKGE